MFGSTRWLVVAGDAVCADALAVSLRDLGAQVRLIDPAGLALGRIGAFDAQFLLTERGQDLRFLRERVSAHPILRWTGQLSLSWSELWRPGIATPHLGRLAQVALPSLEPERAFLRSLHTGGSRCEVNLEKLGPVRALRLLCGERDVFRLRIESLHERGQIELAGELIVSASFEIAGFPPLTGVPALARTMELSALRATIESRVRLSQPTLSMGFEQGLELALRDIRERDGSDSPTLRMASPLALLETEQTEVAEDEIPTLLRPLEGVVSPRAVAEIRDSGVIGKDKEAAPAPTALVPTDGAAPVPTLRPAPIRGQPRDSLLPTASTRLPRVGTSRGQWLALSGTAIVVTLLVMVAAERLWQGEPEVPHAEAVQEPAQRVTSAPPQPPEPTPRIVPGAALPVEARSHTDVKPGAAAESGDRADAAQLERLVRKALAAHDARQAMHYAERLVELKPDRARVRVMYGDALLAAGYREAALVQYRMAEDRAPRSRLVRNRLQRFPK